MESKQFDALTRTFSSRRTALGTLLGGMAALLSLAGPEVTSAHNPGPTCQKLSDPVKRRQCRARARRHIRKRHTCRPQPVAVTCAGRCGQTQNNCRQPVICTCPAGKTCLDNGSCSRACIAGGTVVNCPAGCFCGVAALGGDVHCVPDGINDCALVPLVCTSTAQCPAGHFCSTPVCSGTSRCVPVCPI